MSSTLALKSGAKMPPVATVMNAMVQAWILWLVVWMLLNRVDTKMWALLGSQGANLCPSSEMILGRMK